MDTLGPIFFQTGSTGGVFQVEINNLQRNLTSCQVLLTYVKQFQSRSWICYFKPVTLLLFAVLKINENLYKKKKTNSKWSIALQKYS